MCLHVPTDLLTLLFFYLIDELPPIYKLISLTRCLMFPQALLQVDVHDELFPAVDSVVWTEL